MKKLLLALLFISVYMYANAGILVVYGGADTITNVQFPLINASGVYYDDTIVEQIDPDGVDASNGYLNWDTPYLTIAGAFAEGSPGDEMWVFKYGTNTGNDSYFQPAQIDWDANIKGISNGALWKCNNVSQVIRLDDVDVGLYGFIMDFNLTNNAQATYFRGINSKYINYNQFLGLHSTSDVVSIDYNQGLKNNYFYDITGTGAGASILKVATDSADNFNNVFDSCVSVSADLIESGFEKVAFNYITTCSFDDFVSVYESDSTYSNYGDALIVGGAITGCSEVAVSDLLYIASTGETYPFNNSDTFGLDKTGWEFACKYWGYEINAVEIAGGYGRGVNKVNPDTMNSVLAFNTLLADTQSLMLANSGLNNDSRASIISNNTTAINYDTQYNILISSNISGTVVNQILYDEEYIDSSFVISRLLFNDTPTHTSPIDTDITDSTYVTFIFPIVKGASTVNLQTATDANFSSNVTWDTITSVTAQTLYKSMTNNEVYYWRIRGKND